MNFRRFKNSSHTTIELVFVVVVVAVIAGMALFRANPELLLQQELVGSARQIAGDLRLTRSLAVTHVEQHSLVIVPVSSQYAIYDSAMTQVGETRTLDSGISISGDTTFVFESLGNASSGAAVSLSASGDQYDIDIVAATGMITLTKQ